jgi:hypothetical protein
MLGEQVNAPLEEFEEEDPEADAWREEEGVPTRR